jgi:PIN domain nuclease of toxin-antitoxin system
MRLLLDSHVFVWAKTAPENLSDAATAAIIDPDNEVFVSLATAWELWIKHAKKPIAGFASVLDGGAAAFLAAAQGSDIRLLDITLKHAESAAALPPIHRDPFDRMLIAQATVDQLTLVSADPAIARYKGVRLLAA